jgi:hypothetical protein
MSSNPQRSIVCRAIPGTLKGRLGSDRKIDHEKSLHAEHLCFAYLAVRGVSGYWSIRQGNEEKIRVSRRIVELTRFLKIKVVESVNCLNYGGVIR